MEIHRNDCHQWNCYDSIYCGKPCKRWTISSKEFTPPLFSFTRSSKIKRNVGEMPDKKCPATEETKNTAMVIRGYPIQVVSLFVCFFLSEERQKCNRSKHMIIIMHSTILSVQSCVDWWKGTPSWIEWFKKWDAPLNGWIILNQSRWKLCCN